MYKDILLKLDLTPSQAEIMNFLYLNKEARASEIAKQIKRSRAIVYKELEELEKLDLAEKYDKPNYISMFRATHPNNLEKLMEKREQKLKEDKKALNNRLSFLVSDFKINHNRPGIKYYEGFNGLAKTFNELSKKIKSDNEILSFTKVLDAKNKNPELKKSLENFVVQRVKKKVPTRVIALDTEDGRKLKKEDSSNFRQTKLAPLDKDFVDFTGGEILIYKNSIYSITSHNNSFFVFIVENESIAKMLKAFFEVEWKLL